MTPDLSPRYQTLRELGSGGMGRVYLMRDRYLEKDLALKVLHAPPSDAVEMEQVQREFSLLAAIDHPGVARGERWDTGAHRRPGPGAAGSWR